MAIGKQSLLTYLMSHQNKLRSQIFLLSPSLLDTIISWLQGSTNHHAFCRHDTSLARCSRKNRWGSRSRRCLLQTLMSRYIIFLPIHPWASHTSRSSYKATLYAMLSAIPVPWLFPSVCTLSIINTFCGVNLNQSISSTVPWNCSLGTHSCSHDWIGGRSAERSLMHGPSGPKALVRMHSYLQLCIIASTDKAVSVLPTLILCHCHCHCHWHLNYSTNPLQECSPQLLTHRNKDWWLYIHQEFLGDIFNTTLRTVLSLGNLRVPARRFKVSPTTTHHKLGQAR